MDAVRIVEVGPRDGLQNESVPIPTPAKARFIIGLAEAGLREIECASFVRPDRVPQLADAADLWGMLPLDILPSALVPNAKGLNRALSLGVKRIALFTAASDGFAQKNIGMTVEESLAVFRDVAAAFRAEVPDGWLRVYVSTIFEDPYTGAVDPGRVAEVANAALAMGADEVSLGDTTGVGVPADVRRLHKSLGVPLEKVAWHFHDTRGTGLANAFAALERGYGSFDASAGGLGGCPFAPGATGNLATDDLVYALEREGIRTGVDADRLADSTEEVLRVLGRSAPSRARAARWAARPAD